MVDIPKTKGIESSMPLLDDPVFSNSIQRVDPVFATRVFAFWNSDTFRLVFGDQVTEAADIQHRASVVLGRTQAYELFLMLEKAFRPGENDGAA